MNQSRRRKTTLDAWLNSVITPIYFIDARRRVRFYNTGCFQLTGWMTGDVLGQVCDYHTEDEGVDRFRGELCPPPSVFQGTGHTVAAFLTHKSGHQIACVQECFPLTNAQGDVEGVLVVLSPLEQPRKMPKPSAAQKWHAELASVRQSIRKNYRRASIVGESRSMQRVISQSQLAMNSDCPVWITGETGTGREHLARTIHYESAYQTRAFVPLDCRRSAAIELKRTWQRMLEMINPDEPFSSLQPGSLFLIEAEEFPRDLQQELIELLDRQQHFPADRRVRVIASSTRKPQDLVDHDQLLPEYRLLLSTLLIELPPLRDRLEDLPLLSQEILENLNRGEDHQLEGFEDAVVELFQRYHWPENINELTEVIQAARSQATGVHVTEENLPFRFRAGYDAQRENPAPAESFTDLESYLERVEREHILAALEQSRFNKTKAAELLGIPRAKLYRRLESLDIETED
ncbi:MAG: sigma 54-interacting transcriptional regulator [Planctomycetaceae bacterium]|nr:sigma 54-interacting transcriptional regulator [Planctomycetaceae bacterium]